MGRNGCARALYIFVNFYTFSAKQQLERINRRFLRRRRFRFLNVLLLFLGYQLDYFKESKKAYKILKVYPFNKMVDLLKKAFGGCREILKIF